MKANYNGSEIVTELTYEIKAALKRNLYIVALNSALILPDICGRAEFSHFTGSKRYILWYDKYVGNTDKSQFKDMPYLSGKVIYNLRCSLLHLGNPNIEKDKCNIDNFILLTQKDNGIYIDVSSISTYANNVAIKEYKVQIRGLCHKLCVCAENYYKQNKSKFNFFNYKIEDFDEMAKIANRFFKNREHNKQQK